MKTIIFLAAVLPIFVTATQAASDAKAGACKADGRASYICNVKNVEDLIHIRDTSWVLAGQIGTPPTDGGAYFINIKDGSVRKAAPDFSRARAEIYAACPGAPRAEAFSAHGLGIRYGTAGVHEVFAVSHNERESIEVFDLDVSKPTPSLTWKGCVVVPAAMNPNSVAPLPDGGFVATSFGIKTDPATYQKAATGGISGFVAEWSPARGWSEVPGTQLVANNGVGVSPDGKKIFITTWGDGKLHVISRGEIPYSWQSIGLPEVHPDNLRVLDDGKILIAGQVGSPQEIFTCSQQPVCTVGFKVVRVDLATAAAETLLDEPSNPVFGGASGAIIVGDEIWVGTFRGNRVARYKLRGNTR
ncbi:MAG: hypothetical protein ABW171_12655 [Steroidobacter sp.]